MSAVRKAEMLVNGYVRVDLVSGLVHVWELDSQGRLSLRSGSASVEERSIAAGLFGGGVK